jgi:hypothetical protein
VHPGPLFTAAAVSYAANCALGTAVATRLIDTRRIRWVHHAVYISTVTLAAAAASSAVWAAPRRRATMSAVALAPAAVPLALIPYIGAKSSGHIVTALSAAPFFAASLYRAWRR